MTAKKATDLDDIAEAIEVMATLVDQGFEKIDQRFEQVDKKFVEIESSISGIHREISEMREWMIKIDNRLTGIESDIEEIYDRIVILEAKGQTLTTKDKEELERQLTALFQWAKEVSKQTGIALPKL